jgi:triphosphatase
MPDAKESKLDPQDPFRKAMRSLIASRFAAVWKAVPAAVEGTDPEGVHDVRVASRRLRAAMDVATDCFPNPWYKQLHAVAKSITSELGDVRDREVLLAYFAEEHERAVPNERAGIDRLIARIEREHAAARRHMLDYLSSLEQAGFVEESERRFGHAASGPNNNGKRVDA